LRTARPEVEVRSFVAAVGDRGDPLSGFQTIVFDTLRLAPGLRFPRFAGFRRAAFVKVV
jgi:hypothetical protein